MPEYLLQLDRKLFYFFNHTLSNHFFDWIMPYWRYKKQGIIIILLLLAAFAVSDYGSASIIKPIVKRLRPCNDPALAQTVIRRVDCGTGFSFPSSHASDHFAIAVFLIMVFHKRWRGIWFWCLLWATLVTYPFFSRVWRWHIGVPV
jgi:membrane-associated phospholipid phosphatase